mmetsp:Transcript_4497/g.10868  ORF Transcript_4497/g.10868 Transcript_4497/m.10868 type:complete len:89 (-) Transcript_4497:1131-1397(-)
MCGNAFEGCFQPHSTTQGCWNTNGTTSVNCDGKRNFKNKKQRTGEFVFVKTLQEKAARIKAPTFCVPKPAATAAADPLDDPPVYRSGS